MDDLNGVVDGPDFEGMGYYVVTHKNGERWSTARAFLDTAIERSNLTVVTHAHTEKVIIEDNEEKPYLIFTILAIQGYNQWKKSLVK